VAGIEAQPSLFAIAADLS